MESEKRAWLCLRLPFLPQSREAVNLALLQAGAVGLEEREHDFIAYYPDQPEEALRTDLAVRLARIRRAGLPMADAPLQLTRLLEADWQAQWRRFFKPVTVGGLFYIRPPWEQPAPAGHLIEMIIEPKQAFGTGTHATTQLLLREMVSRRQRLPARVLDVGTGSGILAIAHAKLCPGAHVIGCDIDPIAIANACENSRINGVEGKCVFFAGPVDALGRLRFPLIYANLQRHIFESLLPRLRDHLERGGEIFLSGLLREEEFAMRAMLAAAGLVVTAEDELENWLFLAVRQEG